MTFFLLLNSKEKRLREKINSVLTQHKDLDVGYFIQYKLKGGGVGQTYVFAASDKSAKTKAENMAKSCGGELLFVRKSSEMFFNKKKNRFEAK